MTYRDASAALRDRLVVHRSRLHQIDTESAPSIARLKPHLQERLAALRTAIQPEGSDVDAESLAGAEERLVEYEQAVDEALGLDAELSRTLNPWLPRRTVVLRWLACLCLSMVVHIFAHHLGLSGFFRRAIGAGPQATMHNYLVVYELERAGTDDAKASVTGPPASP
ncbi:MAG: hypothetical protein AAGA56_14465 [Myxococcota bacterium]